MSHYFENDKNLKSEIRELSTNIILLFSYFIVIMEYLVKIILIMEVDY